MPPTVYVETSVVSYLAARPMPDLVHEDPIVAEVRAIREAQFAAAGYDLDEYVRRLREVQATSGHPVISLRPRPAHESAAFFGLPASTGRV